MNVVLVVRGYPENKSDYAGVFNHRLASALASLGQRVTVLKVSVWRPGRSVVSRYTYDGVRVIRLFLPFIPPFGFFGKTKLFFFISDLTVVFASLCVVPFVARRIQADVVHSVSLGFVTIFSAVLSRKIEAKHICQLIGSDVNVELQKRPLRGVFYEALKNVNVFLCNSQALKAALEKRFRGGAVAHVLYRGVDLKRFSRVKSLSPERRPIMTFLFLGGYWAGRGGDKKGALVLLEAWRMLEEHCFNNNKRIKLIMGGSGSERLSEHASAVGLSSVDFIGRVVPDVVPSLMHRANVVVIPSLNEGFPNCGMEAFAASVPVIASNTGGLAELVREGETGWLVRPGDKVALYDALRRAVESRDHVREMGERAKFFATSYLDSRYYAPKVIEIYKPKV